MKIITILIIFSEVKTMLKKGAELLILKNFKKLKKKDIMKLNL